MKRITRLLGAVMLVGGLLGGCGDSAPQEDLTKGDFIALKFVDDSGATFLEIGYDALGEGWGAYVPIPEGRARVYSVEAIQQASTSDPSSFLTPSDDQSFGPSFGGSVVDGGSFNGGLSSSGGFSGGLSYPGNFSAGLGSGSFSGSSLPGPTFGSPSCDITPICGFFRGICEAATSQTVDCMTVYDACVASINQITIPASYDALFCAVIDFFSCLSTAADETAQEACAAALLAAGGASIDPTQFD